MEYRDYLQDEIEQAGRVLAKILSRLVEAGSGGDRFIGVGYVHENLRSELDFDFEKLIALDEDSLKKFMTERPDICANAETVAQLLIELGSRAETASNCRKYLNKALEMLAFVDETTDTASLSRANKKEAIRQLLERKT
ncbi:MAG: hypothetical protein Kow0075_07370 [Salibacteraceae bacterium]